MQISVSWTFGLCAANNARIRSFSLPTRCSLLMTSAAALARIVPREWCAALDYHWMRRVTRTTCRPAACGRRQPRPAVDGKVGGASGAGAAGSSHSYWSRQPDYGGLLSPSTPSAAPYQQRHGWASRPSSRSARSRLVELLVRDGPPPAVQRDRGDHAPRRPTRCCLAVRLARLRVQLAERCINHRELPRAQQRARSSSATAQRKRIASRPDSALPPLSEALKVAKSPRLDVKRKIRCRVAPPRACTDERAQAPS